jgi:hypothetical protein
MIRSRPKAAVKLEPYLNKHVSVYSLTLKKTLQQLRPKTLEFQQRRSQLDTVKKHCFV